MTDPADQPGDQAAPLRTFFEDLPLAVILYAGAIGAASLAAIFVRIAAHVIFNV